MPTLAEYDAWKSGKQQNQAGMANIVLAQPFTTEPDQYAADVGFAREASKAVGKSVPLSLVQDPETRSVFDQIVAEKKRSTVLTQSPRLSEWLRTPGNAEVARDNLEGMSWWETFSNAAGNAVVQRGGMKLGQAYNQMMAEGAAQRAGDVERSFGEIYGEERANVGPIGNVLDNAIGPVTDLWNAGSRVVTARLADMFGGDQQKAAAYYQQQVGIIGDKIAATPMSPGAEIIRGKIGALQPSGDIGQDLANFLGVWASDPAGFTAFVAETAAETAPSLAAAFGVGAVTRNPAAFAGTLGVSSAAQERYLAPSELLAERGLDISTPEGAMAAISDPDLMRDAAERGEIRGLIIGALDTISGGVAGETLNSNPVLNLMLQSLVQSAFGGGGEAAAQVAAGQQLNIADVLIEGLAEFVTAPIEVGGMAASRVREAMDKAPAAQAHTDTLTEMSQRAVADPVRNRMPDAFRDYLRNAMANTQAENLFIPAEQFVEYFQGAGIDPFELADKLTGMSRQDVQTAIDTGGAVKIPTSTWAADMAGTEHDQFVINNSTFSPDAMTAIEAAEFNARAQDALQEAWEEAERIRVEADSLRQVYDIERETLIGSLRAAGRATDVATAEALPMVEFRRVMAERLGYTPEEFAARYPLPRVEGTRPEGLDPKNVDALTRTLAEARNRRAVGLEKRGPTLLEFISDYGGVNDPGGELRARDAAVVKRPGKKTLKLERGGARAVGDMFGLGNGGKKYGFDDVALAAIEAGYLADDPVALEFQQAVAEGREVPDIGRALLDAMDRELRGEASYAGQADVVAEDGLAGVEEYLAGLGLSLDDADADIRAAIEGGEGREYGQAEHLFTPTDPTASQAFREWFGDSKVVDADGKPLVVYHGTGATIGDDFSFDPRRIGSTGSAEGYGFYFTTDEATASGYQGRDGGSLAEVYLSMQKPMPVGHKGLTAVQLGKVIERMIDAEISQGDAEDYKDTFISNYVDTYSNSRANAVREVARIVFDSSESAIDQIAELGNVAGDKVATHAAVRDVTGFDGIASDGYGGRGEAGGTIYVAWFPEQIKSVNNRGTFDATDPRILMQADAGFTGGGRGSIQFPSAGISNGETLVSLFQKADLSTFLHESGHYFLTVMRDAASLDPEGAIAREFETVKAWWRDNADAVARDAGNAVTADDVRNAIDNGTSGDTAKDLAIDTGMQEQFARGVEAYMLEGKAPSPSLRQAFEKFRAWLVSIYRTMRSLNVNVTDELRGVFDRMLATDQEIADARTDLGADVALTAADLGMTKEQFDGFLRLRDQAKADASAKLLAETMAPIKRAREQWFKDERKKVREEVERNTNAQPVYRAMEWMGNRRWLGDDQPEAMPDIRFSKDVLVQRYGAGVLDTLPRGKFTVYAVDGGLDPDDAAGWFGFTSGDAMIKAMERAPNRKEFIEAETDKVMRERHGDVLRDGSVEQEAMEAVHTDSRARELATELQAMSEIAGLDRGLTAKDAKEMARRTLSGMRTRDALNASRFLAAERKAASEVARLTATVTRDKMWVDAAARRVQSSARALVRGEASPVAVARAVEGFNAKFETTQTTFTVPEQTRTSSTGKQFTIPGGERTATSLGFNEQAAALVEAKRRQLLNHALYSEALAVADEVAKAERLTARLAKAIQRRRVQDGKQTISNESLDAIGEIIERYDFRKLTGKQEDRRGALNRYLETMVSQGRENEIAIPARVLKEAVKVPYKTLLVSDLRGVVDTLKNLESTGRRWQRLLVAGKEREFNSAVDTIVTALTDNVGLKPADWVEAGWQKSAKGAVNQYLATFTTASTVLRKIDGREDIGPVYELLKSDIDTAAYQEREMREKAAGEIEAIYSVYSRDEQREMAVLRSIPALGGKSFSKWNLISMALNMGNEGNIHRLTNKKARQHLTPQDVDIVKGLLDKRDWDFVQSVWDYLDTFRPLIEERQKRTTGVAPEWVEASAVETPVGTYRGGYYPIKYAREQGGATTPSLNGDTDIIQSMKLGSYAKAATKNGHLETRVANVQQSLLLDVGVIGQHTNEVIHDLTFSEPVVNTWRMLNDQRVSNALLDAGMQEQHEALKLWLKDVAVGQVFASDFMSRTVRTLRSGFTVSRLAFNVGTALLQPTGLMQSAVVVGKKNLASAIMAYSRDPVNVTNDVIAKSRMMGERRKVFQKDLMDMVAESNISAPTASKFRDFMDRYAVPASLSLMMYTQYYIVDVPTWVAAYDKGMSQFAGNQQRAADYADMTLNRVQGSGLWSERANIERGTLSATVRQNAFVTLFTTLGSYFFAKMNLIMERTDQLRSEPVTAGRAFGFAFDMALLLAGEAAVMKLTGTAIEAAFGGDDDDGEDENLAMYLSTEALKVFAAGLPGIRDGVSVMQGFSGGTYASLLDLLVKPAQQSMQGEFDAALVKSFVNVTGVVARVPAAQANRLIDASWRAMDGDDVGAMEFLLGRPK